MGSYDHLQRCGDLSTADLELACASREAFGELLDRLAAISAPNTGVASILIVLASLASSACDWVDGDLAVELISMDEHTEVGLMIELGAGMRERLFPPVRLQAPMAEITAALELKPDLIGALTVHRRSWKRVALGAIQRVRLSSLPPRISDESLFVVRAPPAIILPATRTSAAPESGGIDRGWDDLDDPAK